MSQLPQVAAEKISALSENPNFSPFLQIVKRFDDAKASKVVEPAQAHGGTLCFVSTSEQLTAALDGQASILIVLNKIKLAEASFHPEQAVYSTPAIAAAMSLVLPFFDLKKSRFAPGIHPTASIDPSAQIGRDVRIGAFAVVGASAVIGDQAILGSHAVVENNAVIGNGTLLHPQTFVGAYCQIGKFCEIHPHTTIGADGFGFIQGPDQRRHKIPQLGIVVLEDHVELGANCAVDRATLSETRIGEGSKFDNFCHVGHNCKIGKHNVFAAGFMVAGSTEIGDYCMAGGGAHVTDHVKIGNKVMLGGRAGVTKDVLEPGAYTGYPLEPFKDGMRTLANLPNLTHMRKQLARIEKHLDLKDEEK